MSRKFYYKGEPWSAVDLGAMMHRKIEESLELFEALGIETQKQSENFEEYGLGSLGSAEEDPEKEQLIAALEEKEKEIQTLREKQEPPEPAGAWCEACEQGGTRERAVARVDGNSFCLPHYRLALKKVHAREPLFVGFLRECAEDGWPGVAAASAALAEWEKLDNERNHRVTELVEELGSAERREQRANEEIERLSTRQELRNYIDQNGEHLKRINALCDTLKTLYDGADLGWHPDKLKELCGKALGFSDED